MKKGKKIYNYWKRKWESSFTSPEKVQSFGMYLVHNLRDMEDKEFEEALKTYD